MALRTDVIAARRRKPGGIDHLPLAFHVQRAGSVATLAADAVLRKSRIAVCILRPLASANLAGVAKQAGWLDRPAPVGRGIGRIPGRDVPGTRLRIPGNGRLEQESIAKVAKAATRNAGSEEVAELPLLSRIPLREPDQTAAVDVVTNSGSGVEEGSRSERGQIATATHRHRCGAIALVDRLVACGTRLVPDKQGREREQ